MTSSRSTPRLRVMQFGYAVVIVLVAVSHGRTFSGTSGELVRLFGFVLTMAAVLGRLWTSLYIAGRKDSELVTDGPYSLCRNPLYVCSVIGAAGIGLAARSSVLALVLPALLALVLWRAVRVEERFLAGAFGPAYADYVARVPRFMPRRAGHRTRRDLSVMTPVYFKAYLDAGAFALLYVVVVAADTLASTGLVPVLFRLP